MNTDDDRYFHWCLLINPTIVSNWLKLLQKLHDYKRLYWLLRLKSKIFCSFSLIFNFLRLQSSILYLYYPPTPVPKFLPHSQKHDLMIVNITHNAYMSVDMHIHVCTYQLSPFSFAHVCLMPWNWKSLCVGGKWIIPEENRFLSVFFSLKFQLREILWKR